MYNSVEFILADSKYSARNANNQIDSVGRLVVCLVALTLIFTRYVLKEHSIIIFTYTINRSLLDSENIPNEINHLY